MGGEVDRTPLVGGGGSEDEEIRAGGIGDELRGAGDREVVETRIGDLDGDVQRIHPLHHLLDQEGRAVEGEVPAHPEGELRFRDPHVERPGRNAGPVPIQLALEEPARKRPVDPDVGLARLARRGDLPADRSRTAALGHRPLDRIALVEAPRPAAAREGGDAPAGAPGLPKDAGGLVDLTLVHDEPI